MISRHLIAAQNHGVADLVAEAVVLLSSQNIAEYDIHTPIHRTGTRGRPRFLIDQTQLENLLVLHFKVPQIASLLGVSIRTVRRRMDDIGLRVSDLFSEISDNELDVIMSGIIQQFPNCGYCLMTGHLRSRNIRIQQQRIKDAFHRIAPAAIAVRWSDSIVRRTYSVSSPLALWHIDGNHKLIR